MLIHDCMLFVRILSWYFISGEQDHSSRAWTFSLSIFTQSRLGNICSSDFGDWCCSKLCCDLSVHACTEKLSRFHVQKTLSFSLQVRELLKESGTAEEHSLNKEARKWATRVAREHKNIILTQRVRGHWNNRILIYLFCIFLFMYLFLQFMYTCFIYIFRVALKSVRY